MLRILLSADPELPVPPRHYGGIERIIDLLAQELVRRGHQVTLFAHPDSTNAGRLIAYPGRSSASPVDTLRNAAALTRYCLRNKVDVIHSFARLQYLLPMLPLRIPKLMTYQRAITPRSVRLGTKLSRGTLQFAGISRHMIEPVIGLGTWHIVPNCASPRLYEFRPSVPDDAPLMFLGRIEELKGTHLAIEIARRAARRLCIAGNVPEDGRTYFETRIKPHIDGNDVVYVGPVDDAEKNRLLGQAAALLMPVLWEEPFGIVMVEAMACGTPVLGLDRGAVPEVVEDGVTGFVRQDVDGLVEAAGRLGTIDRQVCRTRVEREYSDSALADRYLSAYGDVIAACGRSGAH